MEGKQITILIIIQQVNNFLYSKSNMVDPKFKIDKKAEIKSHDCFNIYVAIELNCNKAGMKRWFIQNAVKLTPDKKYIFWYLNVSL